jgi:hypothetical protein
MFTQSFDSYVCDGDTIQCRVDGFDVTARVVRDDSSDAPWEREDGHGPVSQWTSRSKAPGERVLITNNGRCRYYDWAEAINIAKRDGWDAPPYRTGTAGQRAERAVNADFEALKAWFNDEWWYVGIVLSVSRNGIVLDDHAASLWGIDCNHPQGDNSHLLEVANELLAEALEAGRAALERVNA